MNEGEQYPLEKRIKSANYEKGIWEKASKERTEKVFIFP
jgi:hypothetical protein